MSTGAAEKALFSVTDLSQINDKSPRGVSEREKKLRLAVNFRPVNLKQLLEYIEIQDIDPEVKMALKKKASRYPHAALQRFADNFEQMVSTVQRGIRKNYAVEPSVPKLEGGPRPTGQYLPAGVKPRIEPLPVITAKKIDLSEVEYEDTPSDEAEKTVESMEVPVTLSVNVNVKNDIVADSSKEEEDKKKPKPQPAPKPKPQPAPTPKPQAKSPVFSASLSPEDFE